MIKTRTRIITGDTSFKWNHYLDLINNLNLIAEATIQSWRWQNPYSMLIFVLHHLHSTAHILNISNSLTSFQYFIYFSYLFFLSHYLLYFLFSFSEGVDEKYRDACPNIFSFTFCVTNYLNLLLSHICYGNGEKILMGLPQWS